jgi:hypothetical protein
MMADITYVYMNTEITTADTISAVVTNVPDKIGMSDDVMHVYDSISSQLSMSNAKLDSLYMILREAGEAGWGIHQIIALVTIPLIIAIFAFTLPLLFNAAAKIEKRYQSEAISTRLEESWQMSFYYWTLVANVAILFGLFIPCLRPIFIWLLPFSTLLLLIFVLFFYQTVRNFGKPYWIAGQLEEWYKAWYKKSQNKNIRRERRQKIKVWFKRKNETYRRVYRTIKGFGGYNSYYYADRRIHDCLLSLFRVAIDTNDISLMYKLKSAWYQRIEEAKLRSFKAKENKWKFNYVNDLFVFEADAISLLGQCREVKFQQAAVDCLWSTLSHSQIPWKGDVMLVIRSLVFLPKENGANMIKRYMLRANWMFRSLRSIPQMAYICGESVEFKKDKEKECREEWNWIRDIHFLLAAYWWHKGEYAIVNATCPNKESKYYGDIFPVSSADVLYQYICAYNEINDTWGISEFEVEELFDVQIDEMRQMVVEYAAFLMYYTANRDNTYYPEAIEESVLAKVDKIVAKLHGAVQNRMVLKAIDTLNIDISHVEISETISNARIQVVKDIREDVYKKRINDEIKEALANEMSNSMQVVQNVSTEGIYCVREGNFADGIRFNKCSLKMDKTFFTQKEVDQDAIYHIAYNIREILRSRYVYLWLTAINQMQIEEITCDVLHFNEEVANFTGGENHLYTIISFDSPFEDLVRPYMKGIAWRRMSRHSHTLCDKTQLFKENESVAFVIRQEDLPTIDDEEGYGESECDVYDEASKSDGDLTVRFEIDPHLVLRYNKSARILKIRNKKTEL